MGSNKEHRDHDEKKSKKKKDKKKEKRREEASSEASEHLTIKISKADPSRDPLLVSFPNGIPSSLKRVTDSTDEALPSPIFQWNSISNKPKQQTALIGHDETCTYTSHTATSRIPVPITKSYIGIYDKVTKSVTIRPTADNGRLFSLSQSIIEPLSAGTAGVAVDMSNLNYAEKRKLLFESFGSSKKKRQLRSQAANIVKMESVVGAGTVMMEAIQRQENVGGVSGKGKKDAVASAYAEARKQFLPPFDPDAGDPYLVFSPDLIAHFPLWDQITSHIETSLQHKSQDWISDVRHHQRWPECILKLLKLVEYPKEETQRIAIIVLLRHILMFHQYCGDRSSLVVTPEELCKRTGIPHAAGARFSSYFSSSPMSNGLAFTKQLRDKRSIHILILYIMGFGDSMKVGDISELLKEMQLEGKQAMSLLREGGFVVKKNSKGDMSVSLSVPLKFPAVKRVKK